MLARVAFLCFLFLSFFRISWAADNLKVYDDQLRNGFLNWSWAGVYTTGTTFVKSGSYSTEVNFFGPSQALCFYHFPMSLEPYSKVRFWVHGGTVGGQRFFVTSQRNGQWVGRVDIGPLEANKWKLIEVPLESLQLFDADGFTAILLRDPNIGVQPTFYVDDMEFVAKPVSPTGNTIEIAANVTDNIVDERMFSVNVGVYYTGLNSTDNYLALSDVGARVLHFPGGFYSNLYHWQTNRLDGTNQLMPSSFDDFADLLQGLSANAVICTNYGTGTADEAAAWVHYANKVRNLGITYWNVGAENNGTAQPDTRPRPHDPYTYAVEFKNYYTKMKAKDPTIKVGAVVAIGEDTYSNGYYDHPAVNQRTGVIHHGWTPVVFSTLRTLGCKPDYVILHRYNQAPGGENDAVLLSSASSWATDAAAIRQMMADYWSIQWADTVEITCNEHNSVYANPGKQTVSLVNALFYADSFGHAVKSEIKGFGWWSFMGGKNYGGNNGSNLYGWRDYGSYAMMTTYDDPYPTFYAAKLVTQWAKGGDRVIHTESSSATLSAHAVWTTDDWLSILVINRSPNVSQTATIKVNYFAPQNKVLVSTYGIQQDLNVRFDTGNPYAVDSEEYISQSNWKATFPPYSISVLRVRQDKSKVTRTANW